MEDYTKYLRLFGLSEKSNVDDLKEAYRRISLRYHPDVNPDPQDGNLEYYFRVNEAYDRLIKHYKLVNSGADIFKLPKNDRTLFNLRRQLEVAKNLEVEISFQDYLKSVLKEKPLEDTFFKEIGVEKIKVLDFKNKEKISYEVKTLPKYESYSYSLNTKELEKLGALKKIEVRADSSKKTPLNLTLTLNQDLSCNLINGVLRKKITMSKKMLEADYFRFNFLGRKFKLSMHKINKIPYEKDITQALKRLEMIPQTSNLRVIILLELDLK